MLPKNDPEFKKLVDDEMRRLITSREIYPIYDKWFAQPIPPHNKPLNMPVSYLTAGLLEIPYRPGSVLNKMTAHGLLLEALASPARLACKRARIRFSLSYPLRRPL
jgi:hypothetical protein